MSNENGIKWTKRAMVALFPLAILIFAVTNKNVPTTPYEKCVASVERVVAESGAADNALVQAFAAHTIETQCGSLK